MSDCSALDAIDRAIDSCTTYIEDQATGRKRYGWGWCNEAARVINALAKARLAVAESVAAENRQPAPNQILASDQEEN